MRLRLFHGLLLLCLIVLVSGKHHRTRKHGKHLNHTNGHPGKLRRHHPHHHTLSSNGTARHRNKVWNPVKRFLQQIQDESKLFLGKCHENRKCNETSKFRTIDGTCNNPLHTDWGSAKDCLFRLLPADFKGRSEVRQSAKGGPLPSPQQLSRSLLQNLDTAQPRVSVIFEAFGQAVTSDIASSVSYDDANKDRDVFYCCPDDPSSKSCKPTIFRPDNSLYTQFGSKCLNFVKTSMCSSQNGSDNSLNRSSEQCAPTISQSAPALHLDSSMHYKTGSFDADCFSSTASKVCDAISTACTVSDKEELCCPAEAFSNSTCLTVSLDEENALFAKCNVECSRYSRSLACSRCRSGKLNFPNKVTGVLDLDFLYGSTKDQADSLRGESGKLLITDEDSSILNILKKEHNRLASILRNLNSHWDDERIYQETRRILCGKWQAIIFGPYISVLLPRSNRRSFRLSAGKLTEWDPDTRLGVFDSAAVGFNFLRILNTGVSSQYRQSNVSKDGDTMGIWQGRDYGLPPYVEMVKYCTGGRVRIKNFKDMTRMIPKKNVAQLQKSYKDARDVDLYVGILMEHRSVNGSIPFLPRTAACLVARQLHAFKFGDRFYFEHVALVNSFNQEQIKILRKTQLSKLLCDNTNVKEVPENPFLPLSEKNSLVSCSSFENQDLSSWKEESPFSDENNSNATSSET